MGQQPLVGHAAAADNLEVALAAYSEGAGWGLERREVASARVVLGEGRPDRHRVHLTKEGRVCPLGRQSGVALGEVPVSWQSAVGSRMDLPDTPSCGCSRSSPARAVAVLAQTALTARLLHEMGDLPRRWNPGGAVAEEIALAEEVAVVADLAPGTSTRTRTDEIVGAGAGFSATQGVEAVARREYARATGYLRSVLERTPVSAGVLALAERRAVLQLKSARGRAGEVADWRRGADETASRVRRHEGGGGRAAADRTAARLRDELGWVVVWDDNGAGRWRDPLLQVACRGLSRDVAVAVPVVVASAGLEFGSRV